MRSMELSKLKEVGKGLLGLILLAILALGTWWVLRAVWSELSGLDKSVFAALITGTLVASGAIWVKFIEHKHSVEAQFRDAKVELFNEFMGTLDKMGSEDIPAEEMIPIMKEWKRRILFWGGPKVMRGFLSLSTLPTNTKTVGEMSRSMQVMGKLILAMRKDVGLSNRGLVTGATKGVSKGTIMGARYMLRQPDLFLACLRKNPSMPIEEFTILEALADRETGPSS